MNVIEELKKRIKEVRGFFAEEPQPHEQYDCGYVSALIKVLQIIKELEARGNDAQN